MTHTPTQTLLTVKIVQELTQLSRTTIYRLTIRGHLHPVRIGRALRFRRDEVADLMRNGVTTIADSPKP
jgi:excisionase family DNA binding protein